ncbi:MAG: hypothetical protein NTZ38_02265, partial [Candidatus Taylorbacteria bacterium]|nr:hypothetical protein [Candidatus Taylorbacteria bacterium]
KKLYIWQLMSGYSNFLLGYMFDMLFILAHDQKEKDAVVAAYIHMFKMKDTIAGITPKLVRSEFSAHLKKIYLSNTGTIEAVEFEGWSWYIIKYLKQNVLWYLDDLKTGFMTNKKEFESLDFFKVLDEFAKNQFRDTYSYNAFSTDYSREKFEDKIFGDLDEKTDKEKMEYFIALSTMSREFFYSAFATTMKN